MDFDISLSEEHIRKKETRHISMQKQKQHTEMSEKGIQPKCQTPSDGGAATQGESLPESVRVLGDVVLINDMK